MKLWLYIIKASWLLSLGRWYVWRDAPTNIVRRVAVLWMFNRRKGEEPVKLIYEAHKEYQLRKIKEKNHG